MATYDPQGSIPFLDIANRYVITGASFSPQVLAGPVTVPDRGPVERPVSAVAQAIDGTANDITAAIVHRHRATSPPAWAAPAITAIAKKLGA